MASTALLSLCFFLPGVLANPESTGACGVNSPAFYQLVKYKEKHPIRPNFTTTFGTPVSSPGRVQSVGPRGTLLIQDTPFISRIMHMNRERIPERIVHGKGAGAYGHLRITSTEITKYTKAALFSEVGKITPLFVRFSTAEGEQGSADTIRSFRGFAVKCYTKEGNWDIVAINMPVFLHRDPLLFSDLVHVVKRNPVTHLQDVTMFWDFITLKPETTLALLIVHSGIGIPKSFRHIDGHAVNTFNLVDRNGHVVHCKFHLISNQGIQNLNTSEGVRLAGSDSDVHARDLYNSIAKGYHPSWNLTVQIMTKKQAQYVKFNPFDSTKIWPERDFPSIQVGVLTLNKNPHNHFEEVEQVAFCPSRLVPGIEPSPDITLQGRMLSYIDTQFYRLGANHEQLPVNRPHVEVANTERDGSATVDGNQDGSPNYFPNSFNGPRPDPRGEAPPFPVSGNISQYDRSNEDNYSQATEYWNSVNKSEKDAIVANIVLSLILTPKFIQERAVKNFMQVHRHLGNAVAKNLGLNYK